MKVLLTTPVNESYVATLNIETGRIESNDQYNIILDISMEAVEDIKEKGIHLFMDGDVTSAITIAK